MTREDVELLEALRAGGVDVDYFADPDEVARAIAAVPADPPVARVVLPWWRRLLVWLMTEPAR